MDKLYGLKYHGYWKEIAIYSAVCSLVVRASDSRTEGLRSMPDATKYSSGPHGAFNLNLSIDFLEQMKPVKCLHQHDFEKKLRSLFSDSLASDRVTGVNSSYSSSSFLHYCDPKPQFQLQKSPFRVSEVVK
ncbi:hypothetical protein TNCV_4900221 [Trichonephila clavipes]|nr:hypothetical protein TNCV_4900221 [Trichonephila clavipes]